MARLSRGSNGAREQWQRTIAHWGRSALSAREFCWQARGERVVKLPGRPSRELAGLVRWLPTFNAGPAAKAAFPAAASART